MSVNDFRIEIANLKSHKEKVFEQIIEDLKYINGIYLKVSDITDIRISEPEAKVYIEYIIRDDRGEYDEVSVSETTLPTAYFNNRDKFMKDLKDRKARTKRQNLEMMISMAEDQLEQYKKELNDLNDGE